MVGAGIQSTGRGRAAQHCLADQAHWRHRPADQPSFAVFDFTTTHESQIRSSAHRPVHDLAAVPEPTYHPDTLTVRLDWDQYYDKMPQMDAQIGQALAELESAYQFGFRGRMDERYLYVRNYMPHKIYGQFIAYMFQTPATRLCRRMYDDGQLDAVQSRFWETKPAEQLYDLQRDRDEVHNLATSPEHSRVVQRMRTALRRWMVDTRDIGFLPEPEIHVRSEGSIPYGVGHDPRRYRLERIFDPADWPGPCG